MFAFLIAAHMLPNFLQGPVTTETLAIGGVSSPGRRPVPDDAIVERIVDGTWKPPHDGDEISFRGRSRTWHDVKPRADGWFADAAMGNGYLYARIDSPTGGAAILTAQGDALAYVNGALRAGDPYSYGYLHLPFEMRKGENDLIFSVGRGRFRFEVSRPAKPVSLQSEDATLPDLLTSDRSGQWASVVVLNATQKPEQALAIRATLPDGRSIVHRTAELPGLSIRKEPFLIPAPGDTRPGKLDVKVELIRGNKTIDSVTEQVSVVAPLQRQKRTFLSSIDGSVQYYAVSPAQSPSSSNKLVVTLHGASVEATGQIAAYEQKPDVTLVGPTNRRPYGFDWEDIGRLDALEVMGIAEKTYPHDPARVDLTGHSMGGHGTWAIGTLYPGLFASIAPSSGWVSFWSYAGGWSPQPNSPTESILRRAMSVSDTLGRVDNTLTDAVYVLHGDQDDNVPVDQARMMKSALTKLGHPRFTYHEQPGAGHWWGNQCVDWPPIFAMFDQVRLDPLPAKIDFTTQDPAVSASSGWVTVEQQKVCLDRSRVVGSLAGSGAAITTENVDRLGIARLPGVTAVTIDGQNLPPARHYVRTGARWLPMHSGPGHQKSPERGGPFKNVFNRRFLFVVGTTGSSEENLWASDRARFDAETMAYRGNGAVDIVSDREYSWDRFRGRNVVLYGNANSNAAWPDLLADCPIQVTEGEARVGGQTERSRRLGGLILYPNPHDAGSVVGAVCGTGIEGLHDTDRLGLFTSGVAYPDWILFDPAQPDGILADGFFSNDWRLDPNQSAWAH